MDVDKARKIIDAWRDAAKKQECPVKFSSVGADSLTQIYNALLLDLAYQYQKRHRGRGQLSQETADLLKWYNEGASRMPLDFLPDHIYDSVLKRPRSSHGLHFDLRHEAITHWQKGNPEYEVYLERETPFRFCRFLVQIGPDDDLYWLKVYRAIGLPFPSGGAFSLNRYC